MKHRTPKSFEKWVSQFPQEYAANASNVEKLGLQDSPKISYVLKKVVWITNELLYVWPQRENKDSDPKDELSYCLSPFVRVAYDRVFKVLEAS